MNRLIYLIKRVVHLDYSNMFKIAKSVSKKAKKNTFFIILDMIYCGIVYQAGYYDYQEFEFYNLNRAERETYLTRGKNNEIVVKKGEIVTLDCIKKAKTHNIYLSF